MSIPINSAYLGYIKNAVMSSKIKSDLVDALHAHTVVDSITYKDLGNYDIGIEVNSFSSLDKENQILISAFIQGYLACLDPELEYVFS